MSSDLLDASDASMPLLLPRLLPFRFPFAFSVSPAAISSALAASESGRGCVIPSGSDAPGFNAAEADMSSPALDDTDWLPSATSGSSLFSSPAGTWVLETRDFSLVALPASAATSSSSSSSCPPSLAVLSLSPKYACGFCAKAPLSGNIVLRYRSSSSRSSSS